MKLKYIGESFGVDSLTDGKNYEAIDEGDVYRVIYDSGEDCYIQKLILHRLIAVALAEYGWL